MSKTVTILEMSKGKVVNLKSFANFLLTLKDGKHLIEASGADKRSNPQNRYYFGIVVPLIQKGIKDMGTELTKEETHEFLKARFNVQELFNKETGEVINIPISTTRLSKEQFSEYIERIQRFAAEFLSIVIPDAGTQTKIFNDGSALSY